MSLLTKPHLRRLRDLYRSAGWPCHDTLEVDLLAARLLERVFVTDSTRAAEFTLRLTDAGIETLAQAHRRNQHATDAHEALVAHIAQALAREGRIVWTKLSTRAVAGLKDEKTLWRMAMPDVFSIRNTTREDLLEPIVHEIKVHRADLLSDLKDDAKREAYLSLSQQAFYVLKEGIGTAHDIPAPFGVMIFDGTHTRCERFAPKRACEMRFGTWMALAKSTPWRADNEAQTMLRPQS